MKKLFDLIKYLISVVLIIIIVFFALSFVFSKIGDNYLAVIKSGSMKPTIETGSLVFGKKQPEYAKGDIITFFKSKNIAVTHRVVEVISVSDEKIKYRTKGDDNEKIDTVIIAPESVLGKVLLVIPWLGYLILFIKTLPGIIMLIIIPAVWIAMEEILKIRKEIIKKRMAEKKNE